MGLEMARVMTKRGAKVIVACRDEAKGNAAIVILKAERDAMLAELSVRHSQEVEEERVEKSEASVGRRSKKKIREESLEENVGERAANVQVEEVDGAKVAINDGAHEGVDNGDGVDGGDVKGHVRVEEKKKQKKKVDTKGSAVEEKDLLLKNEEDELNFGYNGDGVNGGDGKGFASVDGCPEFIPLDLGSFASIRSFVRIFLEKRLPLNILVNNASAMSTKYSETEEGFESMFGVGQLGHFLLTSLLYPTLYASAESSGFASRIVILTSTAAMTGSRDVIKQPIQNASKFSKLGIYSELKLANGLFAMELERRMAQYEEMASSSLSNAESLNVTESLIVTESTSNSVEPSSPSADGSSVLKRKVLVGAVHPGIVQTQLSNAMMPGWFFKLVSFTKKTVPQGAATACFVACHPSVDENSSGKYWEDCAPAKATSLMYSKSLASKLWINCEKLTKSSFLPLPREEVVESDPLNLDLGPPPPSSSSSSPSAPSTHQSPSSHPSSSSHPLFSSQPQDSTSSS